MNNPMNNNIDFYYTIVCSITEIISRTHISVKETINPNWIKLLIELIAQNESLSIQDLAIKAIRHIA